MEESKPPNATLDAAQPDFGQAKGPVYQQMNYDKLASDRIGEELNHNATIWKLYVEEAKEYDTEFTRERNENLNNMLLFATLFSAIVTAFIIESTNLLEQDSSDVSTQLLLMLVQSQQRIEAGSPNSTSSPVEIPDFVPSATARVINVLWFASLMISLGAAVVAILAKEWLTAYTANRTRDAHKYALERHARLLALEAWKMLLIIDLLPTFLNFSLFVLSLGLIIRLWLLDFVVAGVMTAISGVVCVIYLFFIFAGAIYDGCSYKSRLSAYIRPIVQGVFKSVTSSKSVDSRTKDTTKLDGDRGIEAEEAALLMWLFNYASDPIMANYLTQALAGLRSLKLKLPTFMEQGASQILHAYAKRSQTLAPVFELGAQAVAQLQAAPSRGRNELELCGGMNAARLATAVAEIYPHALTWQLCLPREAAMIRENTLSVSSHSGVPEPVTHANNPSIDMAKVCIITDGIFDALDLIWAETSPALTLTAYAHLLAAELKMVRYALAFLRERTVEPSARASHYSIHIDTSLVAQPHQTGTSEEALLTRCSRVVSQMALFIKRSLLKAFAYTATLPTPPEVTNPASQGGSTTEMEENPGQNPELPGADRDALRERYIHTLIRAALVIKASLSHLTSKGSQEVQLAITSLLSEAMELVQQEKPGPESDEDPHRFGYRDAFELGEISITIATDNKTTYRVSCGKNALGWELMGVLIELCDCGPDTLVLEAFRVAALNLLLTFWPVYVEQRRRDLANDCVVPAWAFQDLETISVKSTPYDSQTSAEILVYQTTILTHITIALSSWTAWYDKVLISWERRQWNNVLKLILQLLMSRSSALPKWTDALRRHPNIRDNIYCKWFPTEVILVDWMSAVLEKYPVSSDLSEHALGTFRGVSWCICFTIAMMSDLPDCEVEGHSHRDVLSQLISTHSASPAVNSSTGNPQSGIAQVMDHMYAASHAANHDYTTSVIGTLLYEVAEYIRTGTAGERLDYLTQGQGFEMLAKMRLAESDRSAAGFLMWAVVISTHTARVCITTEALPSLLKVLCYVFEDDHLPFKDGFIPGVSLQLEQLLKTIRPATLFPIQKLQSQMTSWAKRWEDKGVSRMSRAIISLRGQVKQWVDLGGSEHTPVRVHDQVPSTSPTSTTATVRRMISQDSQPGDTSLVGSQSGQITPPWLFPNSVEAEDIMESTAPTDDDEQSSDQSEEAQTVSSMNDDDVS